jgi:hypothetical protein
MVNRLITLFTPFMSLPSFQAKSNSAVAGPSTQRSDSIIRLDLARIYAISHYTFDKCGYS